MGTSTHSLPEGEDPFLSNTPRTQRASSIGSPTGFTDREDSIDIPMSPLGRCFHIIESNWGFHEVRDGNFPHNIDPFTGWSYERDARDLPLDLLQELAQAARSYPDRYLDLMGACHQAMTYRISNDLGGIDQLMAHDVDNVLRTWKTEEEASRAAEFQDQQTSHSNG